MPRFNGVPVEDQPAASAGPRFKGTPVATGGKHLSFEEGQALLAEEERKQRAESGAGMALAAGTNFINGIPVVGPAMQGAAQRLAAGASSLIDGKDYGAALQEMQQIGQDVTAANPKISTVAEIGGNIAGTLPMMSAAPAAFGMGAGSVPVRMAASGLSGAALGGSDAAVRSNADAGETLKGAGLGGALGVVGPLVGNAVGQAAQSIMSNRALSAAAKQAGTSKPAIDVVARALGADGAASAINGNIAAAGQRAMLADAGPSTLSTLDTAIQRAGPGAGQASERIGARAAAATGDINQALDGALGAPQGMINPLNELRTSTAPARKAAYDAAYGTPINYADPKGQALENIIKTRVPQSAINRANELMRINGEQSQQILAKVADDGTVTLERLPDVRQIDYITRGLRDVAKEADGKGALGAKTDIGSAYDNLSRNIRDLTKSLVPEYKAALDTAAEPIAAREAMLFGQKMLSPSVARDEVAGFVSGLSKAELDSVKGGVRASFSEKLANVKRAISDPNVDARQGIAALRELSSDAAREKMAAIVGQKEADSMFKAVDQAAKSFELRAGVTANSRTYARQAAERSVKDATAPGIIDSIASGKPVDTAQGFLGKLTGSTDAARLAREDQTWGQIADLLTQPAGQAGGTFLQALQSAAVKLPVIDRQAAAVNRAVTGGVAISSGPSRRLLQTPQQR